MSASSSVSARPSAWRAAKASSPRLARRAAFASSRMRASSGSKAGGRFLRTARPRGRAGARPEPGHRGANAVPRTGESIHEPLYLPQFACRTETIAQKRTRVPSIVEQEHREAEIDDVRAMMFGCPAPGRQPGSLGRARARVRTRRDSARRCRCCSRSGLPAPSRPARARVPPPLCAAARPHPGRR